MVCAVLVCVEGILRKDWQCSKQNISYLIISREETNVNVFAMCKMDEFYKMPFRFFGTLLILVLNSCFAVWRKAENKKPCSHGQGFLLNFLLNAYYC